MILWSVTTVKLGGLDRFAKFDSRCVGVFEELEDAKQIVEENCCDIYEGDFPLAVIEKTTTGLYPYVADGVQYWYRWDTETKKYQSIEVPERFERTVAWAFG